MTSDEDARSKAGKLRVAAAHRLARPVWARTRLMQVPSGLDPWAGGSPGAKFGGQRTLGRG